MIKKEKSDRLPIKPKGINVKKEQEIQVFLTEAFPQNTRSSLKSWLQNRKIQVNGKTISKYNHIVKVGDVVSIVKPVIKKKVRYDGLTILFEDEHLLVIDKVEGLLSIAGQNKEEETAFRILSEHVKEENAKQRIFVIHRLDKDTSGVMMYAKTQQVQELMQKNWQDFVLERSYYVVVEGDVEEEEGTIKSWLTEGKTFMVYSCFYDNGGQLAILNFRRLNHNKYFSMLEVNLDTGRKNQIRVQMQAIGHPVAGDKKYGAKTNVIKRIALHAKTIKFIHPITNQDMLFDVPTPKSFYKLTNVPKINNLS